MSRTHFILKQEKSVVTKGEIIKNHVARLLFLAAGKSTGIGTHAVAQQFDYEN